MINNELKAKFDDIYRYEVENSGRNCCIDRKTFWKDLYVPRLDEESVFKAFTTTEAPLLFVTGYVGSGKSTFIRAMYEKYKFCNGIIIDFKAHAQTCFSDTEEVISKHLNNILKFALLKKISLNIKYNIIFNKDKYIDYSYNPEIDLQISDEWGDPVISHQSTIELLILVLEKLFHENIISSFAYSHSILPDSDPTSLRRKFKKAILIKPTIINDFLDLLDPRLLLELDHMLIDSDNPYILTFDNIDAIRFNNIQKHFLDGLINVSNSVNNIKADGNIAQLNQKPIKIVLNVRDENITRLNLSSAGTKRNIQIMLHKDCKDLFNRQDVYHLDSDKLFFYKILKKRLKVILDQQENNEFVDIENIITSQLIKGLSQKGEYTKDEYINLKSISNESVRKMLDITSDISFELLDFLEEKEISISMLCNQELNLQGKILNFLWNTDTIKGVLKSIADSIYSEQTINSTCSNFRMCLTYLYNDDNWTNSFSNLFKNMSFNLATSEKDLKKILFKLYNSGQRESEMISIYQDKIIVTHKDISNKAIIKLNHKGEYLLNNLLKNIDFFGKILENKLQMKNTSLNELMPNDAKFYLDTIYDFIYSLFTYHTNYLIEKLYTKHPSEVPFDTFNKLNCVGKALFLERVCGAHLNSIKNYLFEALKGMETTLLVSNSEKITLEKFKAIEANRKLEMDQELKLIINNIQGKEGDTLRSIFNIVGKYEDLTKQIVELKLYKHTV